MSGKIQELTSGSVKKHYFAYLLPSILSTLATSIYTLADTVMIGQYEGGNGLIALNIVLPIFSILIGFGVLMGVGGGVRYSISKGRGDETAAKQYFTAAFIMLSAVTIILTVVLNVFFTPIMKALGANDSSMPLVKSYGRFITAGAPLCIFAIFLQTILRNDKNPKLAMTGVMAGGALNIILDYVMIFVLKMGMAGGALATIISYGVTSIVCLAHFFRKKNGLKFCFKGLKSRHFKDVLTSGAASLVIEIAIGFMTFILNRTLLTHIGDSGVVVYSVISNTIIVAVSIFNGVAQAAQPLISVNYGAGLKDRIKAINRIVLLCVLVAEALFFVPMQAAPNFMVKLFVNSPSAEVLNLAPFAIRIYFIAALFMGFNVYFSCYFQSVTRSGTALLLNLLRGVVIGGILAVTLPLITKSGNSIWFAVPIAELITAALGFMFMFKKPKKSSDDFTRLPQTDDDFQENTV